MKYNKEFESLSIGEVVFKKSLIKVTKDRKCMFCRTRTNFVDFGSHIPICSDDCKVKLNKMNRDAAQKRKMEKEEYGY